MCPGRSSAARRRRRSSGAAACGRSPCTSPAGADGGGVVEVAVLLDEADDGGTALRRRRDLLEGEEVARDEARLEQEVLRRIAREDELGEHRQVRARRLGLGQLSDDLLGIALEVADGDVQLAQGDAQAAHVQEPTGGMPATATVGLKRSAGGPAEAG